MGIGFSMLGLGGLAAFVLLLDPGDPKRWLLALSSAVGPVCLDAGVRLERSKRAL